MKTRKTLGTILLQVFLIIVVSLIVFSLTGFGNDHAQLLYRLSVVGTLSFLVSVFFYYRATGHILVPYVMIFSSFFFFHFGQNFLIAFSVDYSSFIFNNRYATHDIVINGTIFTIYGILLFNLGALMSLLRVKLKASAKSSRTNLYHNISHLR